MRYGLIGEPLAHSYSKEIHESLGKYEYDLFSLSADEMPEFVAGRNFGGLNVTIPYKQDVIPFCDEVSDLVREIGAANTLYWSRENAGSRKLIGHNTDYEGFLYAADRADIDFAHKNVLVLGSGGTSLMVQKAAGDMGAGRVLIASRRGQERCISYKDLPDIAEAIDIIVNTTPVGTFPDTMAKIISLKDFPNCSGVIDVIYNPFKTALLLEAEELGLKLSNGLPMLVAQATAAAGYFLGTAGAFIRENERIIRKLEGQMQNVVFIGMPGSGKTTIGRLLAEKTGKAFVDMDEEIIKAAGMTISEIFAKEGEEGFRARETKTATELGKQRSLIIATGGGVVLRRENLEALKQNGLIIYIRRPIESLATGGRPLYAGLSALKEMGKKRLPLYESAADITFDNLESLSRDELKGLIAKKTQEKLL
ncbi:MAG: hypothetical protein GX663_06025 [Clostridiales bacterium]|nr:hypothetical protein [Clostridiales bacterium]